MTILHKLYKLAQDTATSLMQGEEPSNLHETDLFEQADKDYILENTNNTEKKKQRQLLLEQIDKTKAWNNVQQAIDLPVRKISFYKYAAAAAIVVMAGLAFYFIQFNNKFTNTTPAVVAAPTIQPGTDKATLVLGNGKTIVLGQGNTYNANGISANGKNITYADNDAKIEYNYLTIPRAGQFQLQLADGTKVWLNSDSQLKFPNQFVDGKPRNVELVYGEAYFEVSPSTAHKGAHFNVVTKGQNVEVLGTQFNIKAYNDETNIVTTLVEGKVELSNKIKTVALIPNQQAKNNILTNSLQTKSVDVYNYIAWKEGIFSFEEMPLKDIMKELERWYDVQVVFKNKKSENLLFSGVFHKNLSIEQILNLINKTKNVAYEINKKTIIMN